MTEREALLKAVCDNPDDDTPRLVFADWLQENGDEPWAEFIRLQCRAARLPEGSSARQHHESRAALLRKHGPDWCCDLPSSAGHRWGDTFTRGFASELTVWDATPFMECVHACFTRTPVTSLSVSCAIDWYRLAELGYLRRLIKLTIDSRNLDAHAAALCELGPWLSLRVLTVAPTLLEGMEYVRANPETVEALCRAYTVRLRLPPPGCGL